VSDDGKALLGEMHRRGAELVAADLQMAAILAEIRAETTQAGRKTDRSRS
jgi:hypothetical protein